MNCRQVGIGAIAATILVLGANASSLDAPAQRAAMQDNTSGERLISMVAQFCGGGAGSHATTFMALKVCGNGALGEALDMFGDVAARLKQF